LVLVLLGLGLVSSALGGIFSAAVYSYATTGSAGQFFRESLLDLIVDLRALPHRPIKKSADCPKSFKREGCLVRLIKLQKVSAVAVFVASERSQTQGLKNV